MTQDFRRRYWVISDHHANHVGALTFLKPDGTISRNFGSVQEMNERMVDNHNREVADFDYVYFLGDISFGNVKDMEIFLSRLKGKKRLVGPGNHDTYKFDAYMRHFKKFFPNFKTFGAEKFGKAFLMSHAPLHLDSFVHRKEGAGWNVHGHTHENNVKYIASDIDDPMYINVCVEKTNYTPVNIEDLIPRMTEA
jgi:calcineurin-like phosphoesterase family protein